MSSYYDDLVQSMVDHYTKLMEENLKRRQEREAADRASVYGSGLYMLFIVTMYTMAALFVTAAQILLMLCLACIVIGGLT